MSYYDVDAILTDAQVREMPGSRRDCPDLTYLHQRLPCTFELDVPNLGFLDGNSGGDVSCASNAPCLTTVLIHGIPTDKIRDKDGTAALAR